MTNKETLFLEDIEIGQKVVPISYTRKNISLSIGKRDADISYVWRKAKELNQPYLYVMYVDYTNERVLCNYENKMGGDYFREFDLISYS